MTEPPEQYIVRSAAAHFGRVPESLLFDQGLTSDDCRIYAILTTVDYRAQEVPTDRKWLQDITGWSRSKVDRALQALSEAGAIRRVRHGRGNPNTILLLADVVHDSPDVRSHPTPMSPQNPTDDSPDLSTPLPIEEKNMRMIEEPGDDGFEAWYQRYPRRIDKARARKAFHARRAEGATVAALCQARDAYATAVCDSEPRYIKHPATFLAKDGPWAEWLTGGDPGAAHEGPGTVAQQMARQAWGPTKGEPNGQRTTAGAATR